MELPDIENPEKVIRFWLGLFILGLVLSGLTAFALETELHWLLLHWPLDRESSLFTWVVKVYEAVLDNNTRYPFLAYGYDWLAFGHLIIALFFIGALRRPLQNKWVITTGMVACIGVFPLAFIAGPVRGIPLYWRLIDCSFGAVGLIPLLICYRKIRQWERALHP
ncbi:MAG TPA: hypothetical protein VNW04_18385 [Puia sp.]|jgi:hypothetical protein|nr:hypothetical protein [Puia sp.]